MMCIKPADLEIMPVFTEHLKESIICPHGNMNRIEADAASEYAVMHYAEDLKRQFRQSAEKYPGSDLAPGIFLLLETRRLKIVPHEIWRNFVQQL